MILGGLLAVPYAVWSKRRVRFERAPEVKMTSSRDGCGNAALDPESGRIDGRYQQ